METREVLNKKHKYWRGFIARLVGALDEHKNGKRVSFCHHDLRHTRKILVSLPNIDVEGSLEYLQENGGFCDCEVLMNVAT